MFKGKIILFALAIVVLFTMNLSAITITINAASGVCPAVWGLNSTPNGGGWCGSATITVPSNWTAGRVWGRTHCNTSTGNCLTGDCGNKIACNGATGVPPATLAEWTLDGANANDYYDLSLVDGFNCTMTMSSSKGCACPQCTGNCNVGCPQPISSGVVVIACNNGSPYTYRSFFKSKCPNAYSYDYDDATSTYLCANGGNYTLGIGVAESSSSTSSTSTSSSSSSSSSSTSTSSSTGSAGTTIQAESYSTMSGVQTEACSDTGGGLDVGWIDTGDWMVYPITVATAKAYTFSFRVASLNGGGVISVDYNAGANVVGSVSVPKTGGWQTWTTITMAGNLPAGSINLGLYAAVGGWNINWWGQATGGGTVSSSKASSTGTSSSAPSGYIMP